MGFVMKGSGVLFLALCVLLSACSDLEDRQNSAKDALTASAHDNQAFRDLQTRAAAGFTQQPNAVTTQLVQATATRSAQAKPTPQTLPVVGGNTVPGAAPFACPDRAMQANVQGVDSVISGARNFLTTLYTVNENAARALLSPRLQSLLGQGSVFALVGTPDKFTGMQTSQAISLDKKTGCASVLLSSDTYQPFNLMFYMLNDGNGTFKVDYVRRL